VGSATDVFAPAPDFRYVGLERRFMGRRSLRLLGPPAARAGIAGTALALGAGVTVTMSGADPHHALFAGAVASIVSALALRRAGAGAVRSAFGEAGARMAIVPWGILVDAQESPRILRWAAVRSIDVVTSRVRRFLAGQALSTRVAVETDHDRFVGEARGALALERLVAFVPAYAEEQATPLALDLAGERAADALEPEFEALLETARGWLDSAGAATELDLPSAGYRRCAIHAAGTGTASVLRRVLGDRTPKRADPRAFAAVVAAELGVSDTAPELVALTQCPHPVVAAVARQAARKLGVPRSRTGTLDEVAPFLWEGDRSRLEAWAGA
jgi:hypothetical protein